MRKTIPLLLAFLATSTCWAVDLEAQLEFDIPPQPLVNALIAFSAQTKLQVMSQGTEIASRRSGGVTGRHTIADAMKRLLAGTDLQFSSTAPNTIAVTQVDLRTGDVETPSNAPLRLVRMQNDPGEVGEAALEEVVVTGINYVARSSEGGTKTDTRLLEVPQTVNVITRDEMAARGHVRALADALGYTPGIFNSQNVRTTFDSGGRLRGFEALNSVYLDDIRIQNGLDRAVPQVDPYGLEQVEVVKGPASVLYGQNSPGGLMNLVSKRPLAKPFHELELLFGGHDRTQGMADFSAPVNADGSLLYRITGVVRDSDSQIEYVKDDRIYVAPSLTWLPREATSLTFLSHYQRDRTGEFNAYGLPALGTVQASPFGKLPKSRFIGEPTDFYDRDQYALGYAFEHRFSERLKVAQNVRYLDMEVDYYAHLASSTPADGRTLERTIYFFDERLNSFGADTRLQGDFDSGAGAHRVLLGVDYRRSRSRSDNGYYYQAGAPLDVFDPVYGAMEADLPPNGLSVQERRQLGLYLQDQWKIGSLIATAGGRYDWSEGSSVANGFAFEDLKDEAFTGRFGLTYVLESGLAPYVSYSESFEPVPGVGFDGNPFVPTTGRQYEAGLKYQPKGVNAFLTVSLFDLTQQNVLTTDLEHQDEGFFQKQVGELRTRGVEVEGKASLQNYDLIVAYSYLDAKTTKSDDGNEGLRLDDTPQHLASAWLTYRFTEGPLNGLNLGGGVRYTGKFFSDRYELWLNDAVTLVDFAMGYELGGLNESLKGYRLSFDVTNLLDKTYINCWEAYACNYGRSRYAQLGMRYRW